MSYQEKDIKHEAGWFWVLDTGKSYAVMVNDAVCSRSESAYAHDEDGLSIAIARCNYLASRHKEKHPPYFAHLY